MYGGINKLFFSRSIYLGRVSINYFIRILISFLQVWGWGYVFWVVL